MTPRELRDQQRHFKILGTQVISFLAQMDLLMKQRESNDRGKAIAALCNALELANDAALRFGLNLERKGAKLQKLKR